MNARLILCLSLAMSGLLDYAAVAEDLADQTGSDYDTLAFKSGQYRTSREYHSQNLISPVAQPSRTFTL